jgi:hypothetical protein
VGAAIAVVAVGPANAVVPVAWAGAGWVVDAGGAQAASSEKMMSVVVNTDMNFFRENIFISSP